MAQPFYLVVASPKKLQQIVAHARSLTPSANGDPVLPVGSARVVLTPPAVTQIVEHAKATAGSTTAAPTLEKVMAGMGAQMASPVSQERLSTLMAAREPEEISATPRAMPATPLVLGNWDWHLKETRLVEAWSLLGDHQAIDWQTIRVGQLDTGFRRVPALGFATPTSSKSDFVLTDLDRDFLPSDFGYDPLQGKGNPFASEFSAEDPLLGGPNDGHGTRTGSVLAGFDPTAETPYFGAAPRVPYIPVRISDTVIINSAQLPLAQGIEYLVQNGCSVLTLSMGMALTVIQDRLRSAINYAYEQGVILVCAAGNIWDPVVAPARLNRTLAVGGSTPEHTPWSGSSFGPEVDLSAPAWPIRRATVDRKGRFSYGYGDGTSFATPAVAGTAALWLLHRGADIAAAYPEKWQRIEAFKRIVTRTAQPGVNWNPNLYGTGILDAYATLTADLPAASSLVKDQPA